VAPSPINTRALADLLHVTPRVIRRWIAKGLPHTRGRRGYVFAPPAVLDWLLTHDLRLPTLSTRAEVAAWLDVHERTIANWLAMGCPGEPGQYDLAAIAAWRTAQGKSPTPDGEAPQARLARVRAEREELRLAVDRRELIPADPALRLISRTIHESKARLDQLPDQLLAIVAEHVPADQLADTRRRLQKTVDACYLLLAEIPTAEEFTGKPLPAADPTPADP
jgi:phage terminase Nu1 subunit (DNA packaging protein)